VSRSQWCATVLLVLSTACVDRYEPREGIARVPLKIVARRNVEVRRDGVAPQERGVLYGDTSLLITRGDSFEMQRVGPEGGCQVMYKGRAMELSSCPWLPGFSDHQWDVFAILNRDE
jgi:hypothetical protein